MLVEYEKYVQQLRGNNTNSVKYRKVKATKTKDRNEKREVQELGSVADSLLWRR